MAANAWIVRDGVLTTRAEGQEILGGITRLRMLALARKLDVTVHIAPFCPADVASADEAFQTSAQGQAGGSWLQGACRGRCHQCALVEKVSITPANANDGRAGPDALPDDPGEVFADCQRRSDRRRSNSERRASTVADLSYPDVHPLATLQLMKDVGLRIRLQRELRDKFVEACRAQDKPAAQVLREFMRQYVIQNEKDEIEGDSNRHAYRRNP